MDQKKGKPEAVIPAGHRPEKGRELFKEMDINGIHVKVYISNTPSSGDSMQRVIDNLIAAYEERIANKK